MNYKVLFPLLTLILALSLAACGDGENASPPVSTLSPVTARELQIVTGQTIYIPAYSEVFSRGSDQPIELAVTLAIHNTDLAKPIIIRSVRYYDTNGDLVREYIDSPVEVPALATTGFVVEGDDNSGGWGANFIVEWGAETPVYEPVIEAIMISSRSTQGFSLISTGRVVSQTVAETE
jgi:hypothetical protein